MFSAYKVLADHTIAGLDLADLDASYDNVSWGDWSADDLVVTYVSGDVRLAGKGVGAGVLVVDGTLEMAGQFEFTGLVIVKGDVTVTGGGQGTHIWGSLLVNETVSLIDAFKVEGQADIYYSTEALEGVEKMASISAGSYETVYYGEIQPGSASYQSEIEVVTK